MNPTKLVLRVSAILVFATALDCGRSAYAQSNSPSLGEMIRAVAAQTPDDSEEIRSTQSLLDDANSTDDESAERDQEAETGPQRNLLASFERLRKPVCEIRIDDGAGEGRVPENRAAELLAADNQHALLVVAIGVEVPLPDRYSVGFSYRPLYYEQPILERCGQSFGYFQNAISGIQFLSNTMTLPYHMTQQRPDYPSECGSDCKTCQSYPSDLNPLPLDPHALLVEMAAISGFAFLLL